MSLHLLEDLEECKEDLKAHPQLAHFFNQFYTKVITPVTSKDRFKMIVLKQQVALKKGLKSFKISTLLKIST